MFITKPSAFTVFLWGYMVFFGIAGCKEKQNPNDGWVVMVGNKVLSTEELMRVIPANLSPEDSAMMADSYINRWIKDQTVVLKAEYNLPANSMHFERQLNDYRNSLLVYAYEKELIKQKLDTVVTENELKTYYDENPRNFELKDYIIRVNYVKLPADAPKQAQVEKWMKSESDADYFELENYCNQFAVTSFFDEQRWLYLDELLKEVPIKITDKENFLKENQYIKLTEANYLYIIKILEYQLKDGISPLELVRADIRNILINKRKKDFINKMRQDLMDEAILNNEVKYNKK
jgi:hypothetical protein